MNTLSEFLVAEIKRRGISNTKFADMCDIASSSMSNYIAGKGKKPTLETLVKLSRTTGKDLMALIELVYPGTFHATYTPEVLLLAQEIVALRKRHQAVYDIVVGIVRGKSGSNNGK